MKQNESQITLTCADRNAPWLAKELEGNGYGSLKVEDTQVSLRGTWEDVYHLNLTSRIAHKVLWLLGETQVNDAEALYRFAKSLPWEQYLRSNGYFTVQSYVRNDAIRDTRFANLKLKDAIVDRIKEKKGERPDSGPEKDQMAVFMFWKEDKCCLYLDSSGETLARHNYRQIPWKAPLMEPLAAAILLAGGWEGEGTLLNPMCGSGTLAIEAAMMAHGVYPGLLRSNFAFKHFLNFDAQVFDRVKKHWESKRKPFSGTIIASDEDARALKATRLNAEAAGVVKSLDIRKADFSESPVPPPEGPAFVILNPEYGERMGEEEDLEPIYTKIGDFLKQRCQGYKGLVFTGNLNLAKKIGLKTESKTLFYNAKLDSRLLAYELYEGSKK